MGASTLCMKLSTPNLCVLSGALFKIDRTHGRDAICADSDTCSLGLPSLARTKNTDMSRIMVIVERINSGCKIENRVGIPMKLATYPWVIGMASCFTGTRIPTDRNRIVVFMRTLGLCTCELHSIDWKSNRSIHTKSTVSHWFSMLTRRGS